MLHPVFYHLWVSFNHRVILRDTLWKLWLPWPINNRPKPTKQLYRSCAISTLHLFFQGGLCCARHISSPPGKARVSSANRHADWQTYYNNISAVSKPLQAIYQNPSLLMCPIIHLLPEGTRFCHKSSFHLVNWYNEIVLGGLCCFGAPASGPLNT